MRNSPHTVCATDMNYKCIAITFLSNLHLGIYPLDNNISKDHNIRPGFFFQGLILS